MTTKRKKSKATARSGINYVRAVVEKCNCIFHEIDLDNDIGNDAHVEFIENEGATGCLIATQIKSGPSYFPEGPEYAVIHSDRDHFEYWNSHSLPIAVIAYNPVSNRAVWFDLTRFLVDHPEVIEGGPYTIRIPLSREFNKETFGLFYQHFAVYRDLYKHESYFGRALRDFADLDNFEACSDGLFSLFSYHRNRVATWYYIISCFKNFAGHPILRNLIIVLCHVPGHPDIFWHKKNIIEVDTERQARNMLTSYFGRDDVVLLLSQIDENGVARGTIGQAIHAIIHTLRERDRMLELVAFDPGVAENTRYWAVVLLAYYEERPGRDPTVVLTRYLDTFPNGEHSDLIFEITETIRLHGGFTLY